MDAPLPLPLADPLPPVAVPSGTALGAPADDVAATFATLLELARLTIDPVDVETDTETANATGDEGVAETQPLTGDALESLLFLTNVTAPTTGTPPPPAARESVTSKSAAAAPAIKLLLPAAPAAAAPATADGAIETEPTIATAMPAVARALLTSEPKTAMPRRDSDALRAALDPGARSALSAALSLPPTLANGASTTPIAAPAAPTTAALAAEMPTLPPNWALAPSANSPAQPVPTFSIDTPVSHPQWREEAAGTIASVVTRGVERAELRVTPPELGPVEVRIDVSRGEATLAIVAAHPATRDALEQALPLLRELLADSGLALGDTSVRHGQRDPDAPRSDAAERDRDDDVAPMAASPLRITLGPARLVDVFA